MIKGCSKRVIVLRDADSECFEQAIFILRERFAVRNTGPGSETKMIDEANRLISRNMLSKYCVSEQGRKLSGARFSSIAVYIMGMATSCAIIFMCRFLFG